MFSPENLAPRSRFHFYTLFGVDAVMNVALEFFPSDYLDFMTIINIL
jgi:hypothetical protein